MEWQARERVEHNKRIIGIVLWGIFAFTLFAVGLLALGVYDWVKTDFPVWVATLTLWAGAAFVVGKVIRDQVTIARNTRAVSQSRLQERYQYAASLYKDGKILAAQRELTAIAPDYPPALKALRKLKDKERNVA